MPQQAQPRGAIPAPVSTAANPATSDPGRLYGGESQAERTARRRQQFLDAGLQLFGTSGYRTATVRQLCKQAELTDRYFYESFAHTEDLLVAVYQQQFALIQSDVVAALAQDASHQDATGAVHAGLNALFTRAADPRVARVCWLEVLGVSPRVDALYNQTFEGFAQLVIGFARAYFPNWTVADDETRVLGMALVGAVSQTVTHWLLGQHRESQAAMVAGTARVFRGVMATV